ncbi:hypothetical protein ACH4TV_16770 [Streptomyces sp. NPDC020898]|uniref:hypothetical protein n=1 Tax=Streptomyces sp. NPDC020898 TaxID=3365101 RepID=UPI0037AD6ECB
MNESSISTKVNTVLDWVGPIPAGLALAIGIDTYRDGGSVGWPIAGALMVLSSLWPIYRGLRTRKGKDTGAPESESEAVG